MHPNVFLKTLWRLKLEPVVFVAMSFDKRYDGRFANVITPAIESLDVNGLKLRPHRVDTSQTGDSILTEIMDGIAHSQLVLADLSTFGRDSEIGRAHV